jgi:hypothetical protein
VDANGLDGALERFANAADALAGDYVGVGDQILMRMTTLLAA